MKTKEQILDMRNERVLLIKKIENFQSEIGSGYIDSSELDSSKKYNYALVQLQILNDILEIPKYLRSLNTYSIEQLEKM